MVKNIGAMLTNEDILQAAEKIEKDAIKLSQAKKFAVIVKGKSYPPTEIVKIASKMKGLEIENYRLSGGKSINNHLKRMGFEVIEKDKTADPLAQLIERYKDHIKTNKLVDEKYKWELIEENRGKPNLNEEDFEKEIKSLKLGNLVYAMAGAVLHRLAKEKPEELRLSFKNLFNENESLEKRIKDFNKVTLKLYREIEKKLSHHQDERTISTYLTYYNPEKYTFYKNSFYKNFCKLLNIKQKKTGSKFVHYLDLINDFIENYIENDMKLIEQVKSYIPQYDGKNHLLLAQDILFQMLEKESGTNEVSFENVLSNFSQKDLKTYFSFLKLIIQKFNLKKGDTRLVFSIANNSLNFEIGQRYCWNLFNSVSKGRYGVISEDKLFQESDSYTGSSKNLYFNFYNEINFSKEEKDSIFNAISEQLNRTNKSSYHKHNNVDFENYFFDISFSINKNSNQMIFPLNQILYGPPGTGKTYKTKEKAVKIIDGKVPESRVSLNKRFEKLVDEKKIVFTTFHQSMSYEDFVEGIKPKILNNNEQEGETDLIYEIKNGILKEIIDKINDEEDLVKSKKENLYIPDERFDQPINKVSLGNTLIEEDQGIYDYCLENNCIAIGFGEDIDFTGVKNRIDIRNRYKDAGIEISNSMDFSISAIERLVIWMEPGQLVFVSNGNRKLKAIGEVTGDYYYKIDTPIKYSQFREVKWLHTDLDIPIKEIYGKFFSQQTIYQIDPKQINKSFFSNQSLALGYKKSNYVLIIDEINRGNVSQIFGELITLLEEDKRKGNREALSVLLPYSKKEFTVPNNLYVIGTMNTADRSVEALDTALRRRFSFQEIMPDPDLLENRFVSEFSLKDILKRINERIEVLIDRDHTIGHSYFMEIDDSIEQLKLVFKDRIIPLLQEYFYGDYGKIGLVLGNGFVTYQAEKSELFANFENYERKDELNNGFYILKTIDEKFDLISALNELLNNNKEEIEGS